MSDGIGARRIDQPQAGFYLLPRQYGPDETRPRLVAEREFVTASIYEDGSPDDRVVLLAEIDGQRVDPFELWAMKLWPISESEYHSRRQTNG